MNKYLAIFGKPRYLGIFAYNPEEQIAKGTTVVVDPTEEGLPWSQASSPEQEAEYRLQNAAEHGDSSSKTTEPRYGLRSFRLPLTNYADGRGIQGRREEDTKERDRG